MKLARWFVTGASGMLGSNLVLTLVGRGRATTAGYGTHAVSFEGAGCVCLPLTDAAICFEVIAACRPSVIVHCAAETRVDYCEDHPDDAYRVNVQATEVVAAVAAAVDAKLVYMSTDAVFNGEQGNYSEVCAPAPRNVYARTKLAGEEAVRGAAPNHLILRTNMFGWSPRRTGLAEWILDKLGHGATVPGFTDVVFAPLLVNDLSDIIDEAVERDLRGTYHAGAATPLTKYAFARLVADAFGVDSSLVVRASSREAGFRAVRPLNTSLSSDRIAAALGRPMPSVADGVRLLRRLHDSDYHLALQGAVCEPS